MNGGDMRDVKKYAEISAPASKYVFVEDPIRNLTYLWSAWRVFPQTDRWKQPVAIWHNNKSNLGFADGHVEMHRWVDWRTIEYAKTALSVISDDQQDNEDLKYMQRGFATRTGR